jgi:transcriptional regulator with XRE-family HTH domain
MRNTTPLRAARELRGLTQTELAERVTKAGHPLSQGALSKLENGAWPSPETAAVLAAELGYPAGLLFTWPERWGHEHVEGEPLGYFEADCGHAWISDLTGSYACPVCGRGDGDHGLTRMEAVDWPLVSATRQSGGRVAAPLPSSALPLVLR